MGNSMSKKSKRKGAPCPAYFEGGILDGFKKYVTEHVGKYVCDPLGTRVWFMDYNFPKMLNLLFRGAKANATKTLEHLRTGWIDEAAYERDPHRLRTLFWNSELIENPDAIHPNCHAIILGDEVYVKKYQKAGAAYKLVFTVVDDEINQRVVTTSFLAEGDRLVEFLGQPAKWTRKPKPEQAKAVAAKLPFPKE
jgi:hypothetical protein